MLKALKRSVLFAAREVGVFRLAAQSAWRRRRLLILCYHGISLRDEHHWRPGLYVTEETLANRLAHLRSGGYAVLPLGEGLHRLYSGTLPERSVAITFDDGMYDFYARAHPLIAPYGYPVTLYLPTCYCEEDVPVFDFICPYVLWRARGNVLGSAGSDIGVTLDLRTERSRATTMKTITEFTRRHRLSLHDRNELIASLARKLGVDYDSLLRDRVLQQMRPQEVAEMSSAGVSIQLHTHDHYSPVDRKSFEQQIVENRRSICAMCGTESTHFCYPKGAYRPEFLPWLADLKIVSATTCDRGFAAPDSHPLVLPRFLDSSDVSEIVFESWLAGVASLLPALPRAAERNEGWSLGSGRVSNSS